MSHPASSEEQRRFFDAQGYLVIPGVLSPGELAALRREADAAEARWRADPALPGVRRAVAEHLTGLLQDEVDRAFAEQESLHT